MTFVRKFQECLKNANQIAIFTHKDSDHDTICSALALKEILSQLGKESTIFVDKLPSRGILKFADDTTFLTSSDDIFDMGVSVDCSDIKRINDENFKVFSNCKVTFNIDHHQDNTHFASYNYVKKGASSCAEVLYYLLKKYFKLNEKLAKFFYTGIYMDSGAFTYNSTTSKTHKCISELLKYCPNVTKNFFVCFGIAGQENFAITQRAFQSVRFFYNQEIAVSVLRKKDFEECACGREDGKFIATYLQNVAGVKVAINISEDKNGEWRVSLRTSCDDVDVSKISHRFNGGGHKKAAGLTLKGELEKALNALVCEAKRELKKWTDFLT